MKPFKLWKYSGLFLIITGILHSIVAILLNWKIYVEIFRSGLINSITKDYARAFAFCFFVCGIFLMLFGYTLDYYIKKEQKPAPLLLGYELLVFSILGCLLDPMSGFWLFIPQAFIIIFSNKS